MNKNNSFAIVLFVVTMMTYISLTSFMLKTPDCQVSDISIKHSEKLSGTGFCANETNVTKYFFNYIVLDSILNELRKEPHWTDGELTMFRDNCKKYLLDGSSNPRKFVIVINDSTGDISINGRKDLHEKFDFLGGFEMSNKNRLYRQVFLAMEEAKDRGIYKLVFTEYKINLR